MLRCPSFASTALMMELYNQTVRHVPKGDPRTALLVRPSALKRHIVDRAAEYLVHCLVRRMADEAGAEVRIGVSPAEARVRQAFDLDTYKPSLKEWSDHVRGAMEVFGEFAAGGQVPHGRILSACQALAHLEFVTLEGRKRMDPVRIDPAIHVELLQFWKTLDTARLPQPRSLAITHPEIAGAGPIWPTQASLFVDGTLIQVVARTVASVAPDDIRLLAAKAAQVQLCGVPGRGDGPSPFPVDRIALMFTRHNRLLEFSLDDVFGPDGWERYLNRFAQLAGIEAEREMEPHGMSMTA